MRIHRSHPLLLILLLSFGLAPAAAQEIATVELAAVDTIFERFDGTRNPGCAVAVGHEGWPVLSRAYGMADLERDAPNTPETIFEPGSVSKQLTAAATILLALDGKLSLDDDVRKYIPELPDYGETITIRHLMNHISGLRDWGAVADIEGWPRTMRVHTHTHVLDIASRQQSLNYRPGEYYSYTNTGYNLQAVLVERVSGMTFAEFSKKRLFEPLDMTRTEWRDDFTRIVKGRAVAYSPRPEGGFRMNMPFENVHGNGGLLTTVGDLLRWTHNLETGEVGGPAFLEEMHRRGVLNSGREIAYASGLRIGEYRGVPEVGHSGATAGYRGYLTRFPDQGIAVAVMCNVGNANPWGLAHEVADLYLGAAITDQIAPGGERPAIELSSAQLEALAGGYRETRRHTVVTLTVSGGNLVARGDTLLPVSQIRFEGRDGVILEFDRAPEAGSRPGALVTLPDGDAIRLEPAPAFEPTPAELAEYTGAYRSDEAEATYTVVVEGGALVVKDRYGSGRHPVPAYPDAFSDRGTMYIFRRDDAGRVTALSLSQSRVWDMRFRRIR
jgi:CubicO group peptidase (beta-lactamase class C family)